jgi:shikimate dehydrogenase
MPANYKAELVGCFGQPVAENPTGVMQEAGFAAAGLNWPQNLSDAVRGARAFGMQGFNLTIPHKVAIMALLDEIAPEAQIIGAVNTVRRDGDRLIGENTDGKGFLRALTHDGGIDPAGKEVVMLGAGGAARAAATELALAGITDLTLINRSQGRVEPVVQDLKDKTKVNVRYELWDGAYRVPNDVDVFINATSIGLFPDPNRPHVDYSQAKSDMLVCDVVFNPAETAFLQQAKQHGLPTLDGLSMLVYQGVLGFEMWTGHPAPEAAMKEALKQALQDG